MICQILASQIASVVESGNLGLLLWRATGTDTGVHADVDVNFLMRCIVRTGRQRQLPINVICFVKAQTALIDLATLAHILNFS